MNTKLSMRRTYTRILLPILHISMIVGMLFTLTACRKPVPSAPRILQEGDDINGMIVATGMADTPPLEAFCNLQVDEELTNTIDCQVPPLPKLAIGHMIGVTSGALQEQDWSNLDWQIYLDGYLLDLDAFDEQSFVEPVMLSSPSPIREVFRHRKTWDVVLINPTFGLHTLFCTVKGNAIVFKWVVNFTITSTRGPLDMVAR